MNFGNDNWDGIKVKMNKPIIKHMWDYQKQNGIVGQCLTNTQYLRDCFLGNGINAESVPVFALTSDGRCVIHMIVKVDGEFYDPSYEIHSKALDYCLTYSEVRKYASNIRDGALCADPKGGLSLREGMKTFLEFIKFAERQNKGEIVVVNKEYYYAQADYVEGKH
jgi:hypothetical protein